MSALYLVNPAADFPTYFSAEVYAARGLGKVALVADLAITTVAAMAPPEIQVTICDENASAVDLDTPAEFVGITGKISQFGRMIQIAGEFRRRGKVVIIGGPYASLSPETLRPHCDILVRGEIEGIAANFFADLVRHRWRDDYEGTRPDLALSPVPRWDLYPNDRAAMGSLQTARGCPFECEFCDVIQYVGRKQRHKPVGQVIVELEGLYKCGYRRIFLADDNFTVYRARAKELLSELKDWNARRDQGRVEFITQVSIDAARDADLLDLCAEAGLRNVFIGIETPNESSLRETKKRQNVGVDLRAEVEQFVTRGIAVTGGMIVGFDSDGPDIFGRQYEFAMSTPIPIFSLGALVAPEATPLHARMQKEGRLVEQGSEVAAMPWSTNIIPRQMTRDELLAGIRWLANEIYQPDAFGERICRFIELLGKGRDPGRGRATMMAPPRPRRVDLDGLRLLDQFGTLGAPERQLWRRFLKVLGKNPEAGQFALPAMVQYMQIRFMYEHGRFWESRASTESTASAQERRTQFV